MDDLIYDRTQADVTYALNNPSSESFLKGAYNYIDFNRVEGWCEYIANVLNSYNYKVDITTKTNWNMSDFQTDQDFERIRQNILNLKKAYVTFTEVPTNLHNFTYKKANDIERILHELDYILMWMENHFVYCGVARCGQVRTWQQRFRRKYSYLLLRTWSELEKEYWNELDELTFADKEVSYYARNTEL